MTVNILILFEALEGMLQEFPSFKLNANIWAEIGVFCNIKEAFIYYYFIEYSYPKGYFSL